METTSYTIESLGKDIRRLERRMRRIEQALKEALGGTPANGSDQATPSRAITLLDTKRLPVFARDAEVFAMIHTMTLDGRPIDAIGASVRSAFGPERTPSRSSIGRYRKRILEAAIL